MPLLIAALVAMATFLALAPIGTAGAGALSAHLGWRLGQRTEEQHPWLVERLADFLATTRIERDLSVSGLGISLEALASRKLRLAGITLAVALILALIRLPGPATIACLATIWAFQGPDLEVIRVAAARRAAIQKSLPFFLFTLAVLTESGLQLLPALDHYCRGSHSALAQELRGALAEIQLGQSPVLAFLDLAQRLDVKDFTFFVGALVQTMEKGTDGLVTTLRMQANSAWDKRRRLAQELGAKASAKLFLPLILFILPAVLAMAAGPAIFSFLTQLAP